MQEPLQITYIGHATCVLSAGGRHLLTDPLLSSRMGWWKRHVPVTPDPATLPPLDAVLISHTHYDHLHIDSFKYIGSDVPVLMPSGTAAIIHPLIRNPIVEVAHWTTHAIAPDVSVTPVPVRHYGGRVIPGLRYRGVNGYVVQLAGHTIYFAGDTSYGTHFREIGNVYHIDLALLPVGGLCPRRTAFGKTMGIDDIQQAARDLRAQLTIPIHWGTFGWGAQMEERLAQHQTKNFRVLPVGASQVLDAAAPACYS